MKRWDCIIKRFDINSELVGAEIGVFKGKMSNQLLTQLPNLTLYAVDRWSEYSEEEIENDPGAKITTFKKKSWDKIYRRTLNILSKFNGRVIIIKNSSHRASKKIENGTLDFVFIDGDHSFSGVKRDIKYWLPKVKKGGFLCGHDYTRLGVKKAVKEFFPENRIVLDDDKTWFILV